MATEFKTITTKSKIQLPNNLVRSPEVSAIEFVILLRLKYLASFRNNNNYTLEVDMSKFKLNVGINDNRTLKKYFKQLYEKGYLVDKVVLSRKGLTTVNVNGKKLNSKDEYTQLPTPLNERVGEIGHIGIRLLYFYESYINRYLSTTKQFCFTSIHTICKETGLNRGTVQSYNEMLRKKKLLHYDKHKLETSYQYDDNDELIFTKYNNHYFVNVNKLSEFENNA